MLPNGAKLRNSKARGIKPGGLLDLLTKNADAGMKTGVGVFFGSLFSP